MLVLALKLVVWGRRDKYTEEEFEALLDGREKVGDEVSRHALKVHLGLV